MGIGPEILGPEIVPGTVYRHYKGNYYEVICLAKHTETLEPMVVYKSIADDLLWVRPYSMFVGKLEYKGEQISRFEKTELEIEDLWWMKKQPT